MIALVLSPCAAGDVTYDIELLRTVTEVFGVASATTATLDDADACPEANTFCWSATDASRTSSPRRLGSTRSPG